MMNVLCQMMECALKCKEDWLSAGITPKVLKPGLVKEKFQGCPVQAHTWTKTWDLASNRWGARH